MIIYDDAWLWMVLVGFIVAFILAFGLGANDVANAFGTSVGAKVLTVRQACILGTIFEILGAILVGTKVSNTIRKGIVSPDIYANGTEDIFLAGNVASLTGSCIWLLLATFFGLPVSGTHSIVGATLGFSIVVNGFKGIGWVKLGMIVASWFISPILSGLVSSGLFKFIDILILSKEKPLENGLKLLPIFYALTVAVNLFSIFYKGSELLYFHKIPLYGTMILTFAPAIIIAVLVRVFLVPRQRRNIVDRCNKLQNEEEHIPTTHVTCIDDVFDQEITIIAHEPNTGNDTGSNNKDTRNLLTENTALTTNGVTHSRDDGPPKHVNGTATEVNGTAKVVSGTATEVNGTAKEVNGTTNDVVPFENKPPLEIVCEEKQPLDGDIESGQEANEDDEKTDRDLARDKVEDKPETAGLFTFLQVLTAVFGSFAHGGNDVSNAIGPLVALWVTATTGSTEQNSPVPVWVLVYGGVGISVGLWVWGRRVMKTMGEDLTKLTPSSGFCIEVGSALTVIIASNIGIPISTTHCKVGSVVCVGRVRSRESVDWKLFRNIILAWCVTLPVSGGLSALAMLGFREIVKATR